MRTPTMAMNTKNSAAIHTFAEKWESSYAYYTNKYGICYKRKTKKNLSHYIRISKAAHIEQKYTHHY